MSLKPCSIWADGGLWLCCFSIYLTKLSVASRFLLVGSAVLHQCLVNKTIFSFAIAIPCRGLYESEEVEAGRTSPM